MNIRVSAKRPLTPYGREEGREDTQRDAECAVLHGKVNYTTVYTLTRPRQTAREKTAKPRVRGTSRLHYLLDREHLFSHSPVYRRPDRCRSL